MDGLLSLLLFAVLFFVMMRFGCGAHIMHGGHGSHGKQAPGADLQESAKDPVCGMDVAANSGYALGWGGATYRFCSRKCMDKFEASPASFAAVTSSKEGA